MPDLDSEDRLMLRDAIASYLHDRYDDAEQRRLSHGDPTERSAHWPAFAKELGLFGLTFSEDQGGLGGGPADQAMVMEEFGKRVVLEPYLSTMIIAGRALRGSTVADAPSLVPDLLGGALVIAFAHGEPESRYDPAHVALAARRDGADYVIDGRKAVVLDAPGATHLLVSARTAGWPGDRDGISLFLVDGVAVGIARRDYRTSAGRAASEITFSGTRVPAARLVTEEHRALPLIELLIDEATLMICAEGLGVIARLLDDTIDYAKQRRQFGQPLASFQVLQHRMADMLIAREHSISMVAMSLRAIEEPPAQRMRRVSAAKVFVGKSLRFVGQQAVQVHGGMGTTDELFIGRLFKRATEIERQFGTTGYHLKRYDRLRRSDGNQP